MYQVKNLDCTVRQGARGEELRYFQDRQASGHQVRRKYRPGGCVYKGAKKLSDGDGRFNRHAGRVSWKKGTGEGKK